MKTVCMFGDGLTLGHAEEDGSSWPLRLAALEEASDHAVTIYDLSVVGDTTVDILDRWERECHSRLRRTGAGGLLFAFGLYDMAVEAGVGVRVPLLESMALAEDLMEAAAAAHPVLWIGPAPVASTVAPMLQDGRWLRFSRARLEALNTAYAEIASRLGVPYLDLMAALEAEPAWAAALAQGDGVHPTPDGHAVIARAVQRWPAWRAWMDGDVLQGARAARVPETGRSVGGGPLPSLSF